MWNLRLSSEQAAADYPALVLEAQRAVQSFRQGDTPQRQSGTGEKFWQFRPYEPGDLPRSIDWRRSARSDDVFTREQEKQNPQTNLFWCDGSAGMDFCSRAAAHSKGDFARILALALAILLQRNGERVGWLGQPAKAGQHEAALDAMTTNLDSVSDISPPPRHARLFMLGGFWDPVDHIEARFASLMAASQDSLLIQLSDPAERDLPYSERTIFEDPDTRDHLPVDHPASIRSAYQDRLQDHIEKLRLLCRNYGWRFLEIRTDQSPAQVLGTIWRTLSETG